MALARPCALRDRAAGARRGRRRRRRCCARRPPRASRICRTPRRPRIARSSPRTAIPCPDRGALEHPDRGVGAQQPGVIEAAAWSRRRRGLGGRGAARKRRRGVPACARRSAERPPTRPRRPYRRDRRRREAAERPGAREIVEAAYQLPKTSFSARPGALVRTSAEAAAFPAPEYKISRSAGDYAAILAEASGRGRRRSSRRSRPATRSSSGSSSTAR